MRIAIIGCGLIGQKRANALGDARLVAVADVQSQRAARLAERFFGCIAAEDWSDVVTRDDVDAVIVSTTNDVLAPAAAAAAERGKHVLVEKPAGRSVADLAAIEDAARRTGAVVRVGFNHRFHPALLGARRLVDAGELGPLLYIRGRYGHGGRLGYEREWRANPAVSGGGELLDQGVHLIDLSRWFLGDFSQVHGAIDTHFWKMPVEDNGFMMLRTAARQTAWLHASCTEWKNLFCLEIFGRDGKLQIDGLGGSYGVERLSFYKMLPQMGPPETTIWEYPGEDTSWRAEFADFRSAISSGNSIGADLRDARSALEIVERIYHDSAATLHSFENLPQSLGNVA